MQDLLNENTLHRHFIELFIGLLMGIYGELLCAAQLRLGMKTPNMPFDCCFDVSPKKKNIARASLDGTKEKLR